jgi:hypothetical protein
MKQAFRIAVMTIGALLITAGNSWANTVYEKVELFENSMIINDVFEITEAGSYLATLTDFEFPVPMVATGMDVTTATSTLGMLKAPGSFIFDATPGNYFVSFFGIADDFASTKLGQYGIDISLVPIPPAVWLFCSGLLGMIGIARRKNAV